MYRYFRTGQIKKETLYYKASLFILFNILLFNELQNLDCLTGL